VARPTDAKRGCEGGQTECDGACTDLLSDPENCGGCGVVCNQLNTWQVRCRVLTFDAGPQCEDLCAPGWSACASQQQDGCSTFIGGNDSNNCGGCGLKTPTGFKCCGGQPIPSSSTCTVDAG
jgi:hypothetical protein